MAETLEILGVVPRLAVPGGEITIECRGFVPGLPSSCGVSFGDLDARASAASPTRVTVRVPEGAADEVVLRSEGRASRPFPLRVATRIAASVHPVTSPCIAPDGSIVTTVSGSRGDRVERPIVRLSPSGERTDLACKIMNPTGLAFGRDGQLYVSSRHDGVVVRFRDFARLEVVAENLGIATGIAFDSEGVLYVGDRSGRIVRIDPQGRAEDVAVLEPSVSAYHLAFDRGNRLLVAGPTFSTRDALRRISSDGRVEKLADGLGRPQGMAVLDDGSILQTATFRGKKGVFRIGPAGALEHAVAAPTLVGLAVAGQGALVLADGSSLYRIESAF